MSPRLSLTGQRSKLGIGDFAHGGQCGGITGSIAISVVRQRAVASDVLVDLVERGVVTNARKGIDAGYTVTGGLFGTARLHAWSDSNAAIVMRACDYTHHPGILSRVHAMHAINSAIEIDLTGQANSESAAGRYLGAVGGQLDFVRGAPGRVWMGARSWRCRRPRRMAASRASSPRWMAVTVTPRSDADFIVTEHGVAQLRGCGFQERARRLAAIAHPSFQDALRSAIKQASS